MRHEYAPTQPHTARFYALRAILLGLTMLAVLPACRQFSHLSGEPGAPCADATSCQQGLTCLTEAEGFPGGYCTDQTCAENDCPGMFAECIMLDRQRNVTACLEACNSNLDCIRDGYICADLDGGRGCMPETIATGSAGAIGSSCSSDGDCSAGNTCLTNFVFGYCSRACTADIDCGGVAHCVDQGGGSNRCMDACTNNDQCRFAYACVDHGVGGVCDLDESSGADRNPAGTEDGQACTTDIQCRGGTCITGEDFPGGYCTTSDCDVVGCATTSSECVNLQSDSLCFSTCSDSAQCRDGYRCTSLESGGKVCYAVSPIHAPGASDTGDIQVQCNPETVSGDTRRIRFSLSANTVGFSVVPFSPSQSEVVPTRMTLPDGSNFNFESEYSFQTINSLLLATIVPMFFPAAPQFQNLVQTGEYAFEFESEDASTCYYVLEQPAPGARLDVNFYLVGVPGINAANAQTNASFQRLLSTFTDIYRGANVTVGTVRFVDVTGEDLDRYRILRDFGAIYRLIAISKAPGPTRDEALSVNVFLIEDFNIGELPGLLGLSAGIPGVPGVHGNGGAGLVFTSANLGSAPERLAQTMAHEVGHFLGLRHTSERGGTEYDPISDTATCSSPEDPYGCPDLHNLMFPFSVDVEQRDVTSQQRYVLQRNPLVK